MVVNDESSMLEVGVKKPKVDVYSILGNSIAFVKEDVGEPQPCWA